MCVRACMHACVCVCVCMRAWVCNDERQIKRTIIVAVSLLHYIKLNGQAVHSNDLAGRTIFRVDFGVSHLAFS